MQKKVLIILLLAFCPFVLASEPSVPNPSTCEELIGTRPNIITSQENCPEDKVFIDFPTCRCTFYSKHPDSLILPSNKWRAVFSYVPVTLKSPNLVPLIYYDEGKRTHYGFMGHQYTSTDYDGHSVINLLRKAEPRTVYVFNETADEFKHNINTKLRKGPIYAPSIEELTIEDAMAFWKNYDSIIYVEDNYEKALIASTYAALHKIPLIIEDYALDLPLFTENKTKICVGEVNTNCDQNYTLGQIQKKYYQESQTDKLLFINPDDREIYLYDSIKSDATSSRVYKIYHSYSLAAPFLASKKKELIVTTKHADDFSEADSDLKNQIHNIAGNSNNFDYLTILAPPNAIPFKQYLGKTTWTNPFQDKGGDKKKEKNDDSRAIDQAHYGDFDSNNRPDLAVGRIGGMTISDVSSYIQRVLLYESDYRQRSENVFFQGNDPFRVHKTIDLGWFGEYTLINLDYGPTCNVKNWDKKFDHTQYHSTREIHHTDTYHDYSPHSWENKHLIYYSDHGAPYWSGFFSSEMPPLEDSIILSNSCYTCGTVGDDNSYTSSTFCNKAFREGALAYMGAIEVSFSGSRPYRIFLNNIYYEQKTLGKAFRPSFKDTEYNRVVSLFGDPTLQIYPKYTLNSRLSSCPFY